MKIFESPALKISPCFRMEKSTFIFILLKWPNLHIFFPKFMPFSILGPDRNPASSSKFITSDRRSMKSNTGGSGGRRSSAGIGGINSQSLGSTSATSGSSSGGKRSVHSGGSIDSANRDRDGLTRQMNILLRTKSESGKRLSDTVRLFRKC